MAFNSSNTIRSRVVGEFEDHISPETDKASKRVQADMDRMAKSASGFIKAVAGIIALREIKQIFTELINFASEHQTAVTGQINKMKSAYNSFMTGIVESPLFGQLIDRITEALSFAAVLIQNSAAWDTFLTMIRAKWNLFVYGFKQSFVEAFSFNVDMIAGMMQKNPGAIAAALAKNFDNDATMQVMVAAGDQAAMDFNKAFESGLKNLKVSAAVAAPVDTKEIMKVEREVGRLKARFTDINQHQKLYPILDSNIVAKNANEIKQIMSSTERDIRESLDNMRQTAFDMLVDGVAQSFYAVGEAMARNQSMMNAFARGMISAAGQIASAYGDLFIKMGVPLLLVNPAQGIALIAAGAALKVLAGFLGAKASGGAPSSAGGSSGPSPVRDFSSDRNQPSRQASTTVNVYFTNNSLDPNNLNEKRWREMAYRVFKEGNDQTNRLDRGDV